VEQASSLLTVAQASSLLTVAQASSLLGGHAEVPGRLEACPTG
jgi:hypothetical protein